MNKGESIYREEDVHENILKNLNNLLEPDDVLFLIADSKNNFDEISKNCPGRVEFDQFKNKHGQIIGSSSIIGICDNRKCCYGGVIKGYVTSTSEESSGDLDTDCKDIFKDNVNCGQVYPSNRNNKIETNKICSSLEMKNKKAKNDTIGSYSFFKDVKKNEKFPSPKMGSHKSKGSKCEQNISTYFDKTGKVAEIVKQWEEENEKSLKILEKRHTESKKEFHDFNESAPQEYVPYLAATLKRLQQMEIDNPHPKDFLHPTKDMPKKNKKTKKSRSQLKKYRENKNSRKIARQNGKNSQQKIKSRKHLNRYLKKHGSGKYTFVGGNKYPGVIMGHKTCKTDDQKVPPYMGWNWLYYNKDRKGWRPGAIPKAIKEIMCHFLDPCPCDTLPVTKRPAAVDLQETLPQKPTIRIQKKNGEYIITMDPLKDTETQKRDPDPYLHTNLLKFRVAPNLNEIKYYQVRKMIQEKGFKNCTCGNIVACCTCRDNKEMVSLREYLDELENRLRLDGLAYRLCLKESSTSNVLDIGFTPPGGLGNLNEFPDVVNQEIQYDENDWKACEFNDKDSKDKGGKGKGGKDGKSKAENDNENQISGSDDSKSKKPKSKNKNLDENKIEQDNAAAKDKNKMLADDKRKSKDRKSNIGGGGAGGISAQGTKNGKHGSERAKNGKGGAEGSKTDNSGAKGSSNYKSGAGDSINGKGGASARGLNNAKDGAGGGAIINGKGGDATSGLSNGKGGAGIGGTRNIKGNDSSGGGKESGNGTGRAADSIAGGKSNKRPKSVK